MRIGDFSINSTYPPRSGGQYRVYNLNRALSNHFEVCQFSFFPSALWLHDKTNALRRLLFSSKNDDFRMSRRPLEHWLEKRYVEYVHSNLFFIGASYILTRGWVNRLGSFLLDSHNMEMASRSLHGDVIQIEDPRIFRWVEMHRIKKSPLVLVEHNVEFLLRSKYGKSRQYLRRLRETEKHAVDNSDLVFVTSQHDFECLKREYDADARKMYVVPNGVDCSRTRVRTQEEKENMKRLLGFSPKKIVLFAGSLHPPNVDAFRLVMEIRKQVKDPDVVFLVAGGVAGKFKKGWYGNVYITGQIEDISPYFVMADIAINPMRFGSGTNVKLLEYLAYGLPVVSTRFGIRGLNISNGRHVAISSLEDFVENINSLLNSEERCCALSNNGRMLVETLYDWKIIAENVASIYKRLLS